MQFLKKWRESKIYRLKTELKFINRQRDKLLVDIYNYNIESKRRQDEHEKALDQQRIFFEEQIEIVRIREMNKWKVIVEERDNKIKEQQKLIDDNKDLYDTLKERDNAFEEMFVSVASKLTSSGKLHEEANQFLLMAGSKYDVYKNKYISKDNKIENKLSKS